MAEAILGGDSVYRTLFECAGDAIYVHGLNKILAVNRKACEMLGYAEDELLSLKPSELDVTDHRMYLPERMAKLKKHKSISFETTHQKKDGTSIPVEVTAQSITWNGELAVMSICRDNTKKRNYDNMLLDAALGWQQTFDAIRDAVFLMSTDHRILRCNKASYKIFNRFKPGEILGKHCWEIVHGTSEQSSLCSIKEMEKTKMRKTVVLKSDERWLEITADPVLDKGNKITGVIHIVADITERKSAEEALRRKNQVFDVSIAANSIADLDGVITEANDAFLQVWGYTEKEEVIGKPIPYFLNEPEVAVVILKVLYDKGRWEGSYTAKRKDGATFIAHGMATVLRDEDGRVTGYQSSVMDITEKKRAEDEKQALLTDIEQERNRLSALIDGIDDEVWFADKHGRFTLANPSALKEFGLVRGEPIEVEKLLNGLEILRLDGTRLPLGESPTLRALAGEVIRNHEEIVRTPGSGSLRYRQVSSSPLRDPDGSIIGAVSVVHDITDRKKSEEALRESQKQYRNLVEGTSDLVTRVNVEGRFLFVNHAAREIYGITPEACIGRLAFDFIHPEDREMTIAAFQNWLKSGRETFTLENRMLDASGRTHYLSWLIRAEYDENGNVKGFASTARDVTEHKLADENLNRIMEELKRSNTSLEHFASVANHDLREPLRTIISFMTLLEEKHGGKLDEGAKEYINLAVDGAKRMENLLAGLLEYSHVNTHGRKLEPIDAQAALGDAVRNLRKIIDESGADITSERLDIVKADRLQLTQLFQNLIHNAIKFRNNQRLQIHIACKKEDKYKLFSVRDNGVGIEPQYHEHIFKLFRRGRPDNQRSGHGIGLAICKNIVERHGGRLWVESEPGKGATFFFTLPNAQDVSTKE